MRQTSASSMSLHRSRHTLPIRCAGEQRERGSTARVTGASHASAFPDGLDLVAVEVAPAAGPRRAGSIRCAGFASSDGEAALQVRSLNSILIAASVRFAMTGAPAAFDPLHQLHDVAARDGGRLGGPSSAGAARCPRCAAAPAASSPASSAPFASRTSAASAANVGSLASGAPGAPARGLRPPCASAERLARLRHGRRPSDRCGCRPSFMPPIACRSRGSGRCRFSRPPRPTRSASPGTEHRPRPRSASRSVVSAAT